MERRIGACLGILAFAVAVAGGLLAANPIDTTVRRALLALFGFFVLGVAVGRIGELVVAERQEQLREELEKGSVAEARESTERPNTDGGTGPAPAGGGGSGVSGGADQARGLKEA